MKYPEPERFCWLCGQVCDSRILDMHYLTGQYVYFCSREHWCTHRVLKDL